MIWWRILGRTEALRSLPIYFLSGSAVVSLSVSQQEEVQVVISVSPKMEDNFGRSVYGSINSFYCSIGLRMQRCGCGFPYPQEVISEFWYKIHLWSECTSNGIPKRHSNYITSNFVTGKAYRLGTEFASTYWNNSPRTRYIERTRSD